MHNLLFIILLLPTDRSGKGVRMRCEAKSKADALSSPEFQVPGYYIADAQLVSEVQP